VKAVPQRFAIRARRSNDGVPRGTNDDAGDSFGLYLRFAFWEATSLCQLACVVIGNLNPWTVSAFSNGSIEGAQSTVPALTHS
jgi:hypothetical protein